VIPGWLQGYRKGSDFALTGSYETEEEVIAALWDTYDRHQAEFELESKLRKQGLGYRRHPSLDVFFTYFKVGWLSPEGFHQRKVGAEGEQPCILKRGTHEVLQVLSHKEAMDLLDYRQPPQTFREYCEESLERQRRKPHERHGQALFNHLLECRPTLAESIRETKNDPFYWTSSESIDQFLEWLEKEW